jgi:N-acetylneuraminic acid mutarotase
MKKTISFVLILILSPAYVNLAAEDTWSKKGNMPIPRAYFSTSVVSGKIYAIGGASSSGMTIMTVEEYDPASDTWTKKANIPEVRWSPSTSVIDGKIFLIGGATDLRGAGRSSVYAYDPATDTWTQKADMPTARQALSTSVVNGTIYAIGGWDGSKVLSTVEQYDPATDTWTEKANIPTARFYLSSEMVDGKIYVIGGASAGTGPVLKTMEEYDPVTDTWTQKADMPTARCRFSTSAVAGRVYAIGGDSIVGAPFSTVEEYNPVMDTWTTKAPMPTGRRALSTSVVGGKIYAIGGIAGGSGAAAVPTVEEYETGLSVPSSDFNGDGIVDCADMCMMVDHWLTDSPLYDIAPLPFGDGIIDVQDLIVLAEHLFTYPGAVSYWKLDEAEGEIAYDSVGVYDGILSGVPTWQPTSGMIDGALQLDGINDYVSTDFVLNPADGSFSAFAWINGGAPGQVVISQKDGVNWLCADLSEGNLMTELKGSGRGADALLSQTIITDGNWHRIGFVWDGSNRTLYVDDVAVAEDPQANLEASYNGLYIGTGKAMEPGSFWSGLIDDVRIYNRAVTP